MAITDHPRINNYMYFVILNELNFLVVLWRIFRNKQVYLISVSPMIPWLGPRLEEVAAYFLAKTWITDAFELFPEYLKWRNAPALDGRADMFARTEDWQAKYMNFAGWDRTLSDYALVFKHATSCYASTLNIPSHALHLIEERLKLRGLQVSGVSSTLIKFYSAYYGGPPRIRFSKVAEFSSFWNTLSAAGSILLSLFLIIKQTGFSRVVTKPVFLGVDYNGHLPDIRMLRDIMGNFEEVALFCRNTATYQNKDLHHPDIQIYSSEDGFYSPKQALLASWLVIKDAMRILYQAHSVPTLLFYQTTKFYYRRTMFRGLFNKYNVQYFLGRDDYNFEHIIRSQELRRKGAVSMGISHGLPTFDPIANAWRYIDFDVYFIFGSKLYESYYKNTWSSVMQVRSIGSYSMPRNLLGKLSDPRPKDIIHYAGPIWGMPILEEVIEVAEAFPKKKVYVKIKDSWRHSPGGRELIERCKNAPPNLIETNEDSYQLMLKGTYALCGTSTIAAEAIHFGLATYVLDFIPDNQPFYYRDFTGLCIHSAQDAIQRIRKLESGAEEYPWDNFRGLANLTGQNTYDAIRDTMGLEPLEGVA